MQDNSAGFCGNTNIVWFVLSLGTSYSAEGGLSFGYGSG